MLSIPLDAYLSILRSMSTEDHPYLDHETHAKELGEAATAMAHSVANFIDVARASIGYEAGRSTLEDLVHTFPVSEEPKSPEEELAAALAALFGAIPEDVFAEDDEADDKK
ncbi:hypothetical protein SEA_KAYLISSA_63 [Arthrobacter phage Kaylissa]|uniref:Uncharacterized protein n=1 Tax=Arthrobacter phage Kaylissa TaxID=2835951 RepID=A0AA92RV49_9CAUD|nr:hypothetical protein PQE14_gp63 [Arthrobacter phage Kaylissa]QGZ17361.1 hypothetical protein SEA_POWERPUFF_63 [Arthrobacter phage Powerpuff]QIN94461.1 hypothetical protein SEA_LEGO_61 [Arthrobacter phage Lego]QIN94552.1 hypothetical protein SEA_YESCHEF_61 [Arthrobacter phage YesChef]QXO14597.1 hypothetical protein SEA_KAYLISSA_63 [Arthrobacter phage Kaylissa]